MEHNCGNCREGKRNGGMIKCRFYGIDINSKHKGCKMHKARIVEVENENVEARVRQGVRN